MGNSTVGNVWDLGDSARGDPECRTRERLRGARFCPGTACAGWGVAPSAHGAPGGSREERTAAPRGCPKEWGRRGRVRTLGGALERCPPGTTPWARAPSPSPAPAAVTDSNPSTSARCPPPRAGQRVLRALLRQARPSARHMGAPARKKRHGHARPGVQAAART